jgi:hypothetical protein
MMRMLRQLTRLFGGGIMGMAVSLFVIALLLVVIIAMFAAVIIFPLFFLGLVLGTAFSAVFYKHMYPMAQKRFKVSISEDIRDLFILNIGDFIDAIYWRARDADVLREECRTKEKGATEAVMRIERGTQSLKDTWQSLVDKHTVKENILASRKLVSTRIKKAAMLTFKDPSFAKLSEELEEETIKFENFLA